MRVGVGVGGCKRCVGVRVRVGSGGRVGVETLCW